MSWTSSPFKEAEILAGLLDVCRVATPEFPAGIS